METIKKGFESDSWLANKIRDIGLTIAQNSTIIKDAMKGAVDDKSMRY